MFEQRLRHVRAVSDLYREEGFDLLLVAAPVASTSELDALLLELGADDHFLVRLDAPEDLLCQRVTAREPAGWSQLDKLVERSREMKATIAALDGVHLSVDTQSSEPSAVARQIRRHCSRLLAKKP